MIRIAIVEDEKRYAQQLKDYITRFSQEFHHSIQAEHYQSGLEFITHFENQYDLILLDISMPYIDGMETALRIRRTDPQVVILFVTNMTQYAIRGYEVDAMDYILKPIQYFSFSQRLNRALGRISRQTRQFVMIAHKDGVQKVNTQEIYYVESQGHDLIYHTAQGELVCSGTMKEAESKLTPYRFFRSNKGYLVSLEHVDCVRDGCAVVAGQSLPISRSRKNAFLEALAEHIGGGMA